MFIDALLKRGEGDRTDLYTNYNAALSLLANAPPTRRPKLTLIQGGLAQGDGTPTSPDISVEATLDRGNGESTLSRSREGARIARLLLAEPSRSVADVREQLGDAVYGHPRDLARKVRWLRRGIYAGAALLRKHQDGTTFEPTSVGNADVDQWLKVMWIIVNWPDVERQTAEHLTKAEFRSWSLFGYAPMAREILDALGTRGPEELERIRKDFGKGMADETPKYTPECVDSALSKLTQL